jgi:hypothetical protein
MGDIKMTVSRFYDKLQKSPNDRYKSWEHCYEQFNKPATDTKYDSLHLAFYLASWGMYRGSSFLLQKDYTVHDGVTHLIRAKQAANEFDINFKILSLADGEKIESIAIKINVLFEEVKNCYGNCASKVSNILVSKILMGTLGITPAFDRFYISGAKKEYCHVGVGVKENIKLAIEFYLKHKNEFDNLSKDIGYPVMKLVDMYFWQKGYEMSNTGTKNDECSGSK